MGNIKTINLKPYFDPKKNISFGGKLETEMFETFNSLDIIWYAPEKTEKLEKWKAFSNVEVYRAINKEELLEYITYNKNTDIIIIMTGKYAEELFTKNEKDRVFFSSNTIIIIYCKNSEYHKAWSKNYKEIKIVTTKPNEIFDYLLKLQLFCGDKFHLFNYKIIDFKKYNFNYFLNNESNELIFEDFSLKLNPYEKYCFSIMGTFMLTSTLKNEMFYDFRCCFSKIINLFYGETIDDFAYSEFHQFSLLTNLNKNIDKPPKNLLLLLTALLLISFYFSKLPYLYGYLNYKEIEKQLKEKITKDILRKKYEEIFNCLIIYFWNTISNKIIDLTQQETLKKIHYFLIDFIKYQTEFNEYSNYPILIRYLMDIDFSLKYFFDIIFELIKFEKYKKNKCLYKIIVLNVDKRISYFKTYINMKLNENEVLKILSKEELIKLNKAIKIKDFIVIGNKGFHQKIKNIENNLSYNKIDYLKISELRNYLNKEIKKNKERNFRYFFIIEIEEMQNNCKEIYSIIKMFSLILHIIIYSKNEKIFINKNIFQIPYIPIFLANSIEEIINYVKSQEFISCGFNITYNLNEEITSLFTQKIKNEQIDDLVFEDDCWELSEKIPKEVFEKIIFEKNWDDSIGEMKRNMLKLLKDNNIGGNEDITYKYAKYFSFKSFPESVDLIDIVIKHFLYAYSRNEEKNSFYYILNKELRSGVSNKTHKYLEIVSIFNTALEQKAIKSYKGEVYRGTYIKNDIIDKILVEGKIVINFAFMSSTKSRKVAEQFLSQQNKNVLFIIETNGNNIDIELECISHYQNEKEVLFVPYSKFSVIKNEKKNFITKKGNNKEIYEITLKGLDADHERKNILKFPCSAEILKIMFENGIMDENKPEEEN